MDNDTLGTFSDRYFAGYGFVDNIYFGQAVVHQQGNIDIVESHPVGIGTGAGIDKTQRAFGIKIDDLNLVGAGVDHISQGVADDNLVGIALDVAAQG